MSDLTTLEATPNVIFSPASASGAMRSAEPDGPTTDPSGPEAAPANLSPRQAKAAGLMTSGTYGPLGTGSSSSAALQSSLVSRLRARTQSLGSTLYKLTWKPWAMPSGLLRSRLRASVLRTSATEPTGWPSPRTSDTNGPGLHGDGGMDLRTAAQLSGWLTPSANEDAAGNWGAKMQPMLGSQAKLTGWPTPQRHDTQKRGNTNADHHSFPHDLPNMAEWCDQPARLTVSGDLLTGSSAGMESGGQLSPEHSRWLMGLPPEWDDCGVTAMQSLRPQRKPSSKRTSKPKKTDIFG